VDLVERFADCDSRWHVGRWHVGRWHVGRWHVADPHASGGGGRYARRRGLRGLCQLCHTARRAATTGRILEPPSVRAERGTNIQWARAERQLSYTAERRAESMLWAAQASGRRGSSPAGARGHIPIGHRAASGIGHYRCGLDALFGGSA